jgi:hypothetical protein
MEKSKIKKKNKKTVGIPPSDYTPELIRLCAQAKEASRVLANAPIGTTQPGPLPLPRLWKKTRPKSYFATKSMWKPVGGPD